MLARVVVIAAALMLAACKTFSPDGGMSVASDVVDRELHKDTIAIRSQDDADAAGGRVRQLLKRPLTADA